MTINTKLRDHSIGAFAVAFTASIATLLMAMMAKVGPAIFTQLTIGLAVVTMLALAAGALMLALLVVTTQS